jgi:hypothetical protein
MGLRSDEREDVPEVVLAELAAAAGVQLRIRDEGDAVVAQAREQLVHDARTRASSSAMRA